MRAVVFDLDGLILDSETPDCLAWETVYAGYGLVFPRAAWLANVGRTDGPFDPLEPFRRPDAPAAPDDVQARWLAEHAAAKHEFLVPLPGVTPLLDAVRARGMRTGVASSSGAAHVHDCLHGLGLFHRFDAVACGDEVPACKPAPDVYLLAARRLGVPPGACVALEDSEPGVRAARAAGMRCIAVPTALTRGFDFSAADLVVGSLVEVTPETIASLQVPSQAPGRGRAEGGETCA